MIDKRIIRLSTLGLVGLIARILVSHLYSSELEGRVEISTPINSWKRTKEAIFLWNLGKDPYTGNIYHESPISLIIFNIIEKYFNTNAFFSILDIVVGIILYKGAYSQLLIYGQNPSEAEERATSVYKTYLLSPLSIIACSGHATSVITNLLISLICYTTATSSRTLVCILCALLTCNNLHYITLTVPTLLCLEYCLAKKDDKDSDKRIQDTFDLTYLYRPGLYASLNKSYTIWFAAIVSIFGISYTASGFSWNFMNHCYLFALLVQDLTPNIGIFWYFFTEVFEHFASFFIWIVQINAFIHAIPLTITLRNTPFFAQYSVLLTSTIFQPYPSLSSISLLFSLTFQWSNLFPYMKRSLIVCCACVSCISLWPIFWHLWIVMGTANSNFYFGATLAFSTSIILFMIDFFNAHGLHVSKSMSRVSEACKESVIS